MRKTILSPILHLVMVSLLLIGCNQKITDEMALILTRVAVETLAAGTAAASAPDTATPTLEPSATLQPTDTQAPSQTPMQEQNGPGQGQGQLPAQNQSQPQTTVNTCNVAKFISDETIDDGTEIEPGDSFTKTWRIRNNGTCTWTEDYQIAWYSDNTFSADTPQNFTDEDIEPGEDVYISIDMVAPSSEGSYYSYWTLVDEDGNTFLDSFYVYIVVNDDASTSTPTPTATSTSTDEVTSTPTCTTSSNSTPTGTVTPINTATVTPTLTPTNNPTVVQDHDE